MGSYETRTLHTSFATVFSKLLIFSTSHLPSSKKIMRYLGIDFGIKRVGLAISDPEGRMAFPLTTIIRTTRDEFFARLMQLIREKNIEAIVVGLPIGLDGQETLTTRQVHNFIASLKRRTAIPIHTVNEALTSYEAENRLKRQGIKGKKRKKYLDELSAVLILESFLNRASQG
jgi:putative Holliday junction resolvase